MIMRASIKLRPLIRILLIDTKPRFRTELRRVGPGNRFFRTTEKEYADWEAGPVIPGSIRIDLDSDNPLRNLWRPNDPCRVAVLQTEDSALRPRLLQIANQWFEEKIPNADRMLAVDEVMDLYHQNGVSIAPRYNAPLKVVRAGGERGFSGLMGAQRPRGIPVQMSDEFTILYLFHLRYYQDMKYLWELGVPRDIEPPAEKEGDYAFKVIRIQPGGRAEFIGSYRLAMPSWYLNQLSDT
jgi:hypothetical protein